MDTSAIFIFLPRVLSADERNKKQTLPPTPALRYHARSFFKIGQLHTHHVSTHRAINKINIYRFHSIVHGACVMRPTPKVWFFMNMNLNFLNLSILFL